MVRLVGQNRYVQLLSLTLTTPDENLALDEALLDEAEATGRPRETLRLWEPPRAMVVIGRSSKIDVEVRRDVCRQLGIPVLRRVSGGASIVAGPGCLMYALVLSLDQRPELRSLDHAHRAVLGPIAAALGPLVPGLAVRGICDLTLGQRKISGNSVRVKRSHMLYHGTLLYNFPLELIGRCLAMPPRVPDYRMAREHDDFVANLPLTAAEIGRQLAVAWNASEARSGWPAERTAQLIAERYSRREWHEQL